MAVAIRLARRGTKKRPFYAIVVADSRYPRDGRFIPVPQGYAAQPDQRQNQGGQPERQ